jgi:hypothetical protein
VNIGSYRWPLNENLIRVLNVKYVVTPPQGLYYEVAGQPANDTPYPVYRDVSQVQEVVLDEGMDSIEVLLGTGPGVTLDYPVTFRLGNSEGFQLFERTVDGATIVDNRWFVLDLPEAAAKEAGTYWLEVLAPQGKPATPLYVWGIREGGPDGWQRFQGQPAGGSYEPVPGSLSLRALNDPGDWVKQVYSGDDLVVYEVADSLPRAWGVSEVEEAANKEEAMARVAAADFDPATDVVVLEGDVAEDYLAGLSDMEVAITDYQSDHMTLEASSPGGGLAVISTRFDDGWKATVDGEDAEIVRADGILMAVPVRAGEHTVELEFAPADVTWGRRITIVTAILTALALGAYTVYRFRGRQR